MHSLVVSSNSFEIDTVVNNVSSGMYVSRCLRNSGVSVQPMKPGMPKTLANGGWTGLDISLFLAYPQRNGVIIRG
ncbi:hypothetical protein TrLO_g9946 [Triparma laevis f. longispina]|uniref:Uncharacterized protein n=1 Tax=Triparma laevis f. longispina TaxID=1714387 RepID=A0A9W6ZD37_9STRA|nr:hypothetical protein TrLO_g9946 [Triparma laevis f. longispina]